MLSQNVFGKVQLSRKDKKKLKRGTKMFGKSAIPHPMSETDAVCSCQTSSNCWLVGDPHLKSFYNKFEKIAYPVGYEFDIYSHEDFHVNATTYGPDIMDNINFGSTNWHIDDCKGQGWIDNTIHTHTFKDESRIEAKVYCKRSNGGKGKMHINLLLTKYAVLEEAMSFEDYETIIESTGECIKKNK